ncbi:MAG TPA: protein-methionine-sulfoxide reductase catalytic subunit MsrP, partial [Verrucomicrobiales bacterium]|nr:protein-methionine-sulfoxide reductase catalytic subunit MsrP [Verrucomicrobiales bacterium]
MANLILPPSYRLSERLITPEHVFFNRRKFMRQLGIAGAGALSLSAIGCREGTAADAPAANAPKSAASVTPSQTYPAPRNPDFDPKWSLTDEETAATYNNFYE